MSRTVLVYNLLNTFIGVVLSVSFKNVFGKEVTTMENRFTTTGNIKTDYNISKLACASNCLVDTECEWIAYSKDTKSCRYHSVHLTLLDINSQSTVLDGWSSFMFYEDWCPYDKGFTHNRHLDLCYKLIPGIVQCSVAYQLCSDEHSRVIVIDSAEKQSFITNMIVKDASLSSTWMDAYWDGDGGEWLWGTGISISNTYHNWDRDQPEIQPDTQPCVGLSAYFSYYWHDYSTHDQLDTICEIRRPSN